MNRFYLIVALTCLVTACQSPSRPSGAADLSSGGTLAVTASNGIVMHANGGGHYLITSLGADVQFAMSAGQKADGTAQGTFHHSTVLNGLPVEFHGEVTCMAVDPVNHRAWIGGVVTKNRSEHPSYTTPIHQPGKDIWFRVLDSGEGQDAEPDRTSFVGFEGSGGIKTSAEYCQKQIWPSPPPNDRTWPVVTGNISVKP